MTRIVLFALCGFNLLSNQIIKVIWCIKCLKSVQYCCGLLFTIPYHNLTNFKNILHFFLAIVIFPFDIFLKNMRETKFLLFLQWSDLSPFIHDDFLIPEAHILLWHFFSIILQKIGIGIQPSAAIIFLQPAILQGTWWCLCSPTSMQEQYICNIQNSYFMTFNRT